MLFTYMDKLLKPCKLEVLPEESEAVKVYDYWLRTFDTFLTAVEAATAEGERQNINKLGLLTSFLTHRTYELIADAANYEESRTSLRNAYHKRKNVVFARHLLMSRVQNSGESIAEYVHALKQLARDCDFQQVSADPYRDESRDAFINGINSSAMHQRLLEEDQLTLQTAVNKAEMLDQAQMQSSYYTDNPTVKSASISANIALQKDVVDKCSLRIS